MVSPTRKDSCAKEETETLEIDFAELKPEPHQFGGAGAETYL
jgi:hypothetical protein